MAKFTPKEINLSEINFGERFEVGDGVSPEAINAPIETAAFVQALATKEPDYSLASLVGIPKVSIVLAADGLPRFKFENLKGEKGDSDLREEIAFNSKRISNLELALSDTAFVVDDNIDYSKNIPNNIAQYAQIQEIGGMTYKKPLDEENLVPYPYINKYDGFSEGEGELSVIFSGRKTFKISDGDGRTYPAGKYRYVVFNLGGTGYVERVSLDFVSNGSTLPTITNFANYGIIVTATESFSVAQFNVTVDTTDDYAQIEIAPLFCEYADSLIWKPRGFYELRHAKVTALVSKGANIWKPDVYGVNAPGWVNSKNNPIQFEENVWYQGLTATGYWDSRNVSNVQTENNRVSFHTALGGYGMTRAFKCKPNTTYTVSFEHEGDVQCLAGFYYKDGMFIDTDWEASEFKTPNQCHWLTICFSAPEGSYCTISNIMLAETEAKIPCTPYVGNLDTFTIPEVVQGLEGYGESVNANHYNFIEYIRGGKVLFNKCVGSADLGTLDWFYDSGLSVFTAPLPTLMPETLNVLCDKYKTSNVSSAVQSPDMSIYGRTHDDGKTGSIGIKDSNYTNVESFKSAMSGVMVYYELAKSKVIDITELLPIDNFLKVQSGGTIIAENEYKYDVPTTITYQKRG